MRQLRNIYGIEMDNGYIEGVRRNKQTKIKVKQNPAEQVMLPFTGDEMVATPHVKEFTQIVRLTPEKEDYLRIEGEAKEKFRRDRRFRLPNGKVDMALIDAVLWWRGASRSTLAQRSLFGKLISEYMPYANIHS